MLRSLVLALSLVAGSGLVIHHARADTPAVEDTRFPIPKDAEAPEATKGGPRKPGKASGGGRISTYRVPRGRAAVLDETRAALKAQKWEILSDVASPSGNAQRIQAKRAGGVWKASFTGDKNETVIILTSP